jgi:hypothetical protein
MTCSFGGTDCITRISCEGGQWVWWNDCYEKPPIQPPSCSAPIAGLDVPGSKDAFIVLATHRWGLCNPDMSLFGPGSDAGLEIAPDGTFYRLYTQYSNTYARGTSANDTGTWLVLDHDPANPPGTYQLNLISNGGTIVTMPTFMIVAGPGGSPTSERKMLASNEGVYNGVYVIVP